MSRENTCISALITKTVEIKDMTIMRQSQRAIEGIIIVFVANATASLFNIALNFFLPKYLTVGAYAAIKTYQLYCTYVSILHFGFVDGVYLEYGGKEIRAISSRELALRINSLRWFELVCMIILLGIVPFVNDNVYFFFVLSVPALNMIGMFQLLYQATGEYKRYSRITTATTIIKAIIDLLIIALVSRDNHIYFLLGYGFLNIFLWMWLEISLRKQKTNGESAFTFSLTTIGKEIKEGFALRVGTLSGFLLSGMDRIFVKALMNTVAFAQYSFAATVENILNVMITPVITTLYNYFCNEPTEKQIRKVRNVVMITSTLILVTYFPVKFMLVLLLDDYSGALLVLAFLYASKSLYMIIQSVYVNLYKARKKQKIYFKKMLSIIPIGCALNYVFFYFLHSKEAFAIATLITSVIWLVISVLDFKWLAFNGKETLYLVAVFSSFLGFACYFNSAFGFIGYMIVLIVTSTSMFPSEINSIVSYVKIFIKKSLHQKK